MNILLRIKCKINKITNDKIIILNKMTIEAQKSYKFTTNITNAQLRGKGLIHIIKKNKGGMVYEKKEIV